MKKIKRIKKEEKSNIKRDEGKEIEGQVQIEINRRKDNTGEQKRKRCEHEGKTRHRK